MERCLQEGLLRSRRAPVIASTPVILSFGVLINLLAMIVIGAWGTFWGRIFGTAFLIETWLREAEFRSTASSHLG